MEKLTNIWQTSQLPLHLVEAFPFATSRITSHHYECPGHPAFLPVVNY
jgi:hypothetical protein